jgi:chromosome segregation ATPase
LPAQQEDSGWQGLSDEELLEMASQKIQELLRLNEGLKTASAKALEESTRLQAALSESIQEREKLLNEIEALRGTLDRLRKDFVELEQARINLEESLRSSEESWRNYRREAEGRIRGLSILSVVLGGAVVGMSIGWGIGGLR